MTSTPKEEIAAEGPGMVGSILKSVQDTFVQAKDAVIGKTEETPEPKSQGTAMEKAVEAKDYIVDRAVEAKDGTVNVAVGAKDYTVTKAVEAKDYTVTKAGEAKDYTVTKAGEAKDYVVSKTGDAEKAK